MTIETRSNYAAGSFDLQIDGHQQTAWVKSVEGGWSRAKIGEEAVGSDPQRLKQISKVEIDPITVEFGLMGAKDMLKWIQQSWNRNDHARRNGQITHGDFGGQAMFEHHFYRALITETTFPTLDGASKEDGYIKCKLQPESVVAKALGSPGPQASSNATPAQKMWTPTAFRLCIDDVDDMQYANKIDSFTVTLETKTLYVGASRLPEIIPLHLKFPNITGTIGLRYAEKLIKWHEAYIRSEEGPGTKDKAAHKSGCIEFLSPDRTQTIFRINLAGVGLSYVGVEGSKANADQIKRVKFELYVHKMSIEGSSTLGFV
jgi:tail tube protein gp19